MTDYSNGASTPTGPELEIDSALQAALREPRERMNLLKLEQALVDFINSTADWLEVGGLGNAVLVGPSVTQQAPMLPDYRPATSFQRCICHRLADRFNIVRENGMVLDGSIRLVKLANSRIPPLLLQNFDMSAFDSQPQSSVLTDAPVSLLTDNGGKRPKMKLMKRKDSDISASSKQTKILQPNRSSGSLTDKERAYEEARARIFGSESGQDNGDEEEGARNVSVNAPGHHAFGSMSDLASSETTESAQNASSSNLATLSSSMSNFENKAIYRNREEEAADPDFRRGVYAPAFVPAAAATVPTYPFVSPEAEPVMFPSSVFRADIPAGSLPPIVSTPNARFTTSMPEPKSAGLTADAPAFYPTGQSTS